MKAIHLRAARAKKNLTQEQLETLSGVSQAVISELEREGDRKALYDTVVALAKALDIDPEALRFGPDPKSQERMSA